MFPNVVNSSSVGTQIRLYYLYQNVAPQITAIVPVSQIASRRHTMCSSLSLSLFFGYFIFDERTYIPIACDLTARDVFGISRGELVFRYFQREKEASAPRVAAHFFDSQATWCSPVT